MEKKHTFLKFKNYRQPASTATVKSLGTRRVVEWDVTSIVTECLWNILHLSNASL